MPFVFGLPLENVRERSVSPVVQPSGSRDMLLVKGDVDFGCSHSVRREIEYLFNNPPRVLVGDNLPLELGGGL